MATPKIFAPSYDSPSNYQTEVWLWIASQGYPYALTTRPMPIRINKTLSPMAHYTKVVSGQCKLLTSLPKESALVIINNYTHILFERRFPMHDQLGQLIEAEQTGNIPLPPTYNSPSNPHLEELDALLTPLDLQLPPAHILRDIQLAVNQRIETTTSNTNKVKRYRQAQKDNPYVIKEDF